MRKVLACLVSALVGFLASAQIKVEEPLPANISDIRGDGWQKLEHQAKAFYVRGFLDGSEISRLAIIDCADRVEGTQKPRLVGCVDLHVQRFGRTSVEAIVKGIDRFYSDHKNTNIHAGSAIDIVGMEIGGKAREEIERRIEDYRKVWRE